MRATSSDLAVVMRWLAAANAGDADAVLALSAPDIRLVGPRGTAVGHDALRAWLAHAGATFATRAGYARDGAVVVAQHVAWRDPATGAPRGEAEVATRFVLRNGRVAELERHDALASALAAAGLSAIDRDEGAPVPDDSPPLVIRRCRADEQGAILALVNAAAERYRGAIPADCWHEPYMSAAALARDVAAGVEFRGCEDERGELVGVMGIQPVKDVHLVRHAYVRPDRQGQGIGGRLLAHLESLGARRVLIGTWADATWAIRFYESHGYALVPARRAAELLRTYWDVSPRQAEVSVVLEKTR